MVPACLDLGTLESQVRAISQCIAVPPLQRRHPLSQVVLLGVDSGLESLFFRRGASHQVSNESLILAQNQRWRRA